MADTGDLTKLKTADLKKLLKERGLPISGNKADLIARLQSQSQNTSGDLQDDALLNEEDDDLKAIEAELDRTDDLNLDSTLDKSDDNIQLAQSSPKKPVPVQTQQSDGGEGKAAVSAPDIVHEEHKSVSLAKTLTDSEKLEIRAKKFGAVSEEAKKELRAKKFGLDVPATKSSAGTVTSPTGGVSIKLEDIDRLKKRGERFGDSVSPSMKEITEKEKQLKRQQRFGGTISENNFEKKNIRLGDDEKKEKRAQRFGTDVLTDEPVTKTEKITSPEAEDRKRKRAERFGAVISGTGNVDIDEKKKKRLERFK